MKILVTGATGFVGSNMMNYLRDRGYVVFGCGRKPLNEPNDKYFICDLVQDTISLDVDVIIHTAAMVPSENARFQDYFDNNCLATMNIIKYARQHNVKRIIHMGAVASYGDVDGVLREDSPHEESGDYGLTKYVTDKLVKDSGIPYYILTLPGVVGKGAGNCWIMNTARKLYRHEDVAYYNGKGLFNNILDVQDLCKFVVRLLQEETDKSETYLLGSRDRMRIEEVVSFIKDGLSSNSQLYHDKKKRNSFYLDISKALSNGFSPKPMEELLGVVCEEVLRKREC